MRIVKYINFFGGNDRTSIKIKHNNQHRVIVFNKRKRKLVNPDQHQVNINTLKLSFIKFAHHLENKSLRRMNC